VPPEKRAAVQRELSELEQIPLAINAPGSHILHA
jgi:hypothetical protein